MTRYNVHIYREMKLRFDGIEAESPEAAANIARDGLTEDADDIEPCDGETLSAQVDVVGGDQYEQSRMIDFDGERIRKTVPKLLEALDYLLQQTVDQDLKYGITLSEGEQDARDKALAVIADATSTADHEPGQPIVIEVRGGMVQDVRNVPPGIEYEIKDYDSLEDETNDAGRTA